MRLDGKIDLVEDTMEISSGQFSGLHSVETVDNLSGIVPNGTFWVEQDTLRLVPPDPLPIIPQEIGATIELLASNKGGRQGPTPQESWRCTVKVGSEYMDCLMYLGFGQSIAPGDRGGVRIRLLDPNRGRLLPAGQQFEIWEGRVVGRGAAEVLF